MRIITAVCVIIFLPCILFAEERRYLVKLKCSNFQDRSDRIICIEEQCYALVDSTKEAKILIKAGVASEYEPNTVRGLADHGNIMQRTGISPDHRAEESTAKNDTDSHNNTNNRLNEEKGDFKCVY